MAGCSFLTRRTILYVPRPDVEAQLEPFFGVRGDDYAVVIGPRGCGKSTVVHAALANRPGIIRVELWSTATEADVYAAISL